MSVSSESGSEGGRTGKTGGGGVEENGRVGHVEGQTEDGEVGRQSDEEQDLSCSVSEVSIVQVSYVQCKTGSMHEGEIL